MKPLNRPSHNPNQQPNIPQGRPNYPQFRNGYSPGSRSPEGRGWDEWSTDPEIHQAADSDDWSTPRNRPGYYDGDDE